eukprot:XP_011455453.1 PREDICTED: uncharacterized protein LOC105347874 [Crassostrea gigas]
MTKFWACFLLCFIAFANAVSWPDGTYTLVKPMTGCPSGWSEGWRFQDNENDHNTNSISQGHHFFGSFGRNFKFYYCTRNANEQSITNKWPSGNYCILRHGGSCPSGFQTSIVSWDDEDDQNQNSHGGTLPSGLFDNNTRIYYCCRNDGSYSKQILLPTSHPFYLLIYTTGCQFVAGMHMREEFVRFDDENDYNRNSVFGTPPMGAGGRNHRLFYCYYWLKRLNISCNTV